MLEDGKGSGRSVGVNPDNKLQTEAETHSLQHSTSEQKGQAYQAQSIDSGVTAKTQTLLHIRNDDDDRNMVITYIRMQQVTTGTIPASGIYFEVGVGDTVSSGGTATTPVNMNQGSGNLATVTATGVDPTMAGTFTAIDTQYVSGNGTETVYNKEGTIILGKNDTLSIRLTTTETGVAKARISFLMIDKLE